MGPGGYRLWKVLFRAMLSLLLVSLASPILAVSTAPPIDRVPDAVLGPGPAPLGITLTAVAIEFNNPIGIDHHEPSNKVVMSVNYPEGEPYNFELVAPDGTRTQFSDIHGFTNEVKIATVRSSACEGGFTVGELFTGTGVEGEVARIAPDGSSVANPWVTLPGEFGLIRGSLFQDRYCAFGGDLIVVTTSGGVWRVTSSGVPTLLADLGTHLEGVTTVPDDSRYGPWAGKILAGAELTGCLYAIDTAGNETCWSLGIAPEDIDLISPDENFYGVDHAARTLWGADAPQWTAMVGDIAIAQEVPGDLWRVRWNGQSFDADLLATVGQWEHVTFSPARLPSRNSAPTVTSFVASPGVEGEPLTFTATASDPEGDPLEYMFDFESDGTWDLSGTNGTAVHVYGDDFVGTATVRVSDGKLNTDATTAVVVANVAPSFVGEVTATVTADVRLRAAGEKWHDVAVTLYDRAGATHTARIVRAPGSPEDQTATVPGVRIDALSSAISAVVEYTPFDDPVNGQANGATPVWLILVAGDGTEVWIHRTFNVRHPETWTWTIAGLPSYLVGFPISFEGVSADPGSDDLTFTWTWGDGSTDTVTTYFNDGVRPDPDPSPDVNPIEATDIATHVFAAAGTYTVTLTVTDDDGGSTVRTLIVIL